MKILQINKYPSLKGGTEKVLFDTIDLLKNEGHQVVLFSTDEGHVSYSPTYTIPYTKRHDSLVTKLISLPSFFYNNKAAKQLEEIIEKEKPDIAHIHLYLNSFSVSILPVLKKHNIPVVMTLHEYRQICPSYLLLDRHGNICERCVKGNYLNCLITRCAKGSFVESAILTAEMYYRRRFYKTENYVDKFICVSDFVFDKHKQFNTNISDKSLVIYNPVDTDRERMDEKEDYLLFFGRLSKEKGLDTLIKSMKILPHIKLKIVGEGIRDNVDIPENIEFVGFRKNEDLKNIISEAKFTIAPSESNETFGLSCAESLALGTPAIASDIGALPEMVQHGYNGFLFAPKSVEELKETIKKAIDLSDQEYYTMSENARDSVEKYSAKNYISKLLGLYKQLLSDRL